MSFQLGKFSFILLLFSTIILYPQPHNYPSVLLFPALVSPFKYKAKIPYFIQDTDILRIPTVAKMFLFFHS